MNLPEPFIVAEIGGNHLGSLDLAIELIEAAAYAGADAVKFQCFTPDTITLNHDGPDFVIKDGPWEGRTLYDLYTETQTPWEWFEKLFVHAEKKGLIAFSSVFDKTSIEFLEDLDCPIYKISSFEITDLPLIEYAASKGKPLIISRGMASDGEMLAAWSAGNAPSVLHCISAYPAPVHGSLYMLRDKQGLSDHTLSTILPAVAIGTGAKIIEKHLCLARSMGGADAGFSLEPPEFKEMVKNCREAWEAIQPTTQSTPYKGLRRSIYACADIAEGEEFTETNIRSIRPGGGLHPRYLPRLLGKTATRDIQFGKPLTERDLEKDE